MYDLTRKSKTGFEEFEPTLLRQGRQGEAPRQKVQVFIFRSPALAPLLRAGSRRLQPNGRRASEDACVAVQQAARGRPHRAREQVRTASLQLSGAANVFLEPWWHDAGGGCLTLASPLLFCLCSALGPAHAAESPPSSPCLRAGAPQRRCRQWAWTCRW